MNTGVSPFEEDGEELHFLSAQGLLWDNKIIITIDWWGSFFDPSSFFDYF